MTDAKRRILLKGSLTAGAVGAAVGTGLLTPRALLAAWPESAFAAEQVDDALKELLGTTAYKADTSVKLKAPDIAENGAVVPVTVLVKPEVKDIDSISIIATGNQTPLVASFKLGEGALGFVSTRIKMAKTATVVAFVKAGDQVMSASKEVKVTIGGCGG